MRASRFNVLMSVAASACLMSLGGCQSGGDNYTERERPVEYRLDDEKALAIYAEMVQECELGRWRDRWDRTSLGRDPKVLVGRIRNETDDFVDTRLLTNRLESNFLGSRSIRVVSDPTQQDLPPSVKGLTQAELLERGESLDADFVIAGTISDYQSEDPQGRKVWMYELSLDMIAVASSTVDEVADVEASEKVWTRTEALEKQER